MKKIIQLSLIVLSVFIVSLYFSNTSYASCVAPTYPVCSRVSPGSWIPQETSCGSQVLADYKVQVISYQACLQAQISSNITPASVNTTGSFELNDFPDSFNAVAGQEFKAYINFIYSGSRSRLGVSITGNDLPDDVKLGYIEYGSNGVNSILFSGIPRKVKNYPLKLVLTDNYGIVLTKNFTFNVSGLVFKDESFPNAVLKKPYSMNINFTYAGSKTPVLSVYDLPENLQFSFLNFNASDGVFNLKFTPFKIGKYAFKGDAMVDGVVVGTKTFSITVDDPTQIVVQPTAIIIPTKEEVVVENTAEIIKKYLPKKLKKIKVL